MKIINLTPHPVVILRDDAEGNISGFTGTGPAAKEGKFSLVGEYAPTGSVARATQRDEVVGALGISGTEVPLIRTTFGSPTDLPAPETDTYLVVSVITAQAAKASGRTVEDILITSDPVRDEKGKFIGVRKFALL